LSLKRMLNKSLLKKKKGLSLRVAENPACRSCLGEKNSLGIANRVLCKVGCGLTSNRECSLSKCRKWKSSKKKFTPEVKNIPQQKTNSQTIALRIKTFFLSFISLTISRIVIQMPRQHAASSKYLIHIDIFKFREPAAKHYLLLF